METIAIVRGNDFKLRIPITRHALQVNGTVEEREFSVESAQVLKVFLESCDCHAVELPWTQDVEHDGTIIADVDGRIGLGTYNLIIAGISNGNKFRSKERRQLRIVDNNERANIWPIEYDGFESYSLDTMVVLDCRGRDGLSAYELAVLNGYSGTETQWLKDIAIKSITKTGTKDLVDTYTITYGNGSTSTFTVTNGESAYHMAVRLGRFSGTEAEWVQYNQWPELSDAVNQAIRDKVDDVLIDNVSACETDSSGNKIVSLSSSQLGRVKDVQVNGTSVVNGVNVAVFNLSDFVRVVNETLIF